MSKATAERIPDNLIQQAKGVDLRNLAGRYVELRNASGPKELEGACPKCGESGHTGAGPVDRFHCQADWFFCRHCHEQRGDAIEFVRWLQPGLSFAEAVAQLTGGSMPAPATSPTTQRRPERKPAQQQQPADWRQKTEAMVQSAYARLWGPEGEAGRAYLEQRGLEPSTWLAYGLGFRADAPLPGTKGEQRAPAIALPWRSRALGVYAVRYRFLATQRYTDLDGKERQEKLVAETGSTFAGMLFGGQVLPDFVFLPIDEGRAPAESTCTMLICEGEINAMSAHQVAGETALHVLSIGSESASLSSAAIAIAQRYGRLLVWADKEQVAQKLMAALPGAVGIKSPAGKDANDLLKAGLLGGFLATVRIDAAKSRAELERLFWDYYDAARLLAGIDASTAAALAELGKRLGKGVDLCEIEPGRWVLPYEPTAPAPATIAPSSKAPLPEHLWRRGLPTFKDAWAIAQELRKANRVAYGRASDGFYVIAPGAVL